MRTLHKRLKLAKFAYACAICMAAGTALAHVPYKGEGAVTPNLLYGCLQSSINSAGGAIGLHKEGKLRALAVMLKNRSPLLPHIPTVDDANVQLD